MLGSIAFQLSLVLWPQKLQPYAWAVKYVWMVWAVAGVVWLIAWLVTKNRTDVAPAVPAITFAPVITQTANPVVLQSQISPQEITSRPTTAKSELEPNLVCVSTPTMRLYQENSFVFRDARDSMAQGSPAVVAIIANRPASGRPGVAAVYGVKAQIICRNAEHELYSGFGAWVDHFSNMADFPPAQLHKLIILIQDGHPSGLVFGMTNPRSYPLPSHPWSATKSVFENSPPNDMPVLKGDALAIEVTLFDGGRILGTFIFKYERREDGTLNLNRMPPTLAKE